MKTFLRPLFVLIALFVGSSAIAQMTYIGNSTNNGLSSRLYRNDYGYEVSVQVHVREQWGNGSGLTDYSEHDDYYTVSPGGVINLTYVYYPNSSYYDGDSWYYYEEFRYDDIQSANPTGPVETWGAFDDPQGWSYGAWTPDPSTVDQGQYFTQSRPKQQYHRTGERSNLGNERNVGGYWEFGTDYQGNYGTKPPPQYNGATWNSFTPPSAVYVSTAASVSFNITNSGTKPWGGNHYAGIIATDYSTSYALPSANGINPGGVFASSTSWTAPGSPGTYTYRYQMLENGVEWFGPTSTFSLNVAAQPTVTITADAGSVYLGQSTTIRANFSTDTAHGDSQIQTAINWNPGSGESTVSGYGPGNLTYTFTPTQTGTHTFLAYIRSSINSNWRALATVQVTVSKQPTTFTISPTTFNYTGGSQGPTITPTPANATWSVTAGQQTATNAGSYTVTATANGNFTGSNGPVSWTINKVNANTPVIAASANPVTVGSTTTFTASNGTTALYSWLINGAVVSTYNGAAWSATSGSYTGGTWTLSGWTLTCSPTSVTNFSINFRDNGDANRNSVTSATTNVTVNPITATFNVTPTTFTYNGSAQGPAANPSPAGATYTATAGSASQTNAGSYSVTYTANGNYSGTSGAVAWTINKAAQTVAISPTSQTIVAGGSITFTGSGGNYAYTWGGTSGASGAGTTKAVTFSTAGTYTVTVQDLGGTNHNASNTAAATITVNPAVATFSGAASLAVGSAYVSSAQASRDGGTTTKTATYTINNTGTAVMSVAGITFSGTNSSEFSITQVNGGAVSYPFNVAASGSATVTVTFAPAASASAIGNRTATMTVANNSTNTPSAAVSLSGTGMGGVITAAQGTLRSLP